MSKAEIEKKIAREGALKELEFYMTELKSFSDNCSPYLPVAVKNTMDAIEENANRGLINSRERLAMRGMVDEVSKNFFKSCDCKRRT